MSDKTIVVGDVHVAPDQSLRRATWLGRLVHDIKPDRIVFIGDFGTFDSLSAWDRDKRKLMENRRYYKDIHSMRTFLSNYCIGSNTPDLYGSVEHILTEGNHEDRIRRYIDINPIMERQLDYADQIGIADTWKIVPYKSYYTHKAVAFTHAPINEGGKPVSGKTATAKVLELCDTSVVFGHTHKLDYKAAHRHGKKHLQEVLNVGCFFEHVDEYALGSMTSYWRGIVVLNHYDKGRFGYETIPLGLLRREYDNKINKG
jgi:predicted phosphodiesterase